MWARISSLKKKIEIADKKSKTVTPLSKDSQDKQVSTKIKLFDFLSHIHTKHMFGLYHFIMNECEVSVFENSIIKLAGEKFEEDIKKQLTDTLKNWSQEEWKISFTTKENFQPLQNELKTQAKSD